MELVLVLEFAIFQFLLFGVWVCLYGIWYLVSIFLFYSIEVGRR
jgi:hypothetical protein